jgi:HprK-related kinase A
MTNHKIAVGPFNISISTDIDTVEQHLNRFYGSYPRLQETEFVDFYVSVVQQKGLRRWIKPQVCFELDGFQPFKPLPIAQAAAQFEWGLNWCIASLSHQFLIIHSSVVEKNGEAIIMPGAPGSGKSTLSAALAANGWRLLSDEMALVSLENLQVYPVPRPISLKGTSIPVIQSLFKPEAFGPMIKNTLKGDLSHLAANPESIQKSAISAQPRRIIFPKYNAEIDFELQEKHKADTCMALIENVFNFNMLGAQGFDCCCQLVDAVSCYRLEYSNLDQAINQINQLSEQ